MELEKKVAIIVVNYQTPWHLNECLSSVYENTDSSTFKLFVVHNNPDEESILTTNRFELEHPGTIEVIQNEKNLGFVEGVNSAYEKAKSFYRVCFLNSDTIVTRDWLRTLNAVLDVDQNVVQVSPDFNHYYDEGSVAKLGKKAAGVFTPAIRNSLDKFLLTRFSVRTDMTGFHPYTEFYDFCSGACNLARMEPFIERGYFFDPNIIHGYGDDFDTSYYLKKFGTIGVCKDSYVLHFLNVSIDKFSNEKKDIKERIKKLNMFYVVAKWEEELDKELESKSIEAILYIQKVSTEVRTFISYKGMQSIRSDFKEYVNSIPARDLWLQLNS